MSAQVKEKCQFCGSERLAVGYQMNDGDMLSDYFGKSSCKIVHVICKDCGSIVHSKVEKPEIFDDRNKI